MIPKIDTFIACSERLREDQDVFNYVMPTSTEKYW